MKYVSALLFLLLGLTLAIVVYGSYVGQPIDSSSVSFHRNLFNLPKPIDEANCCTQCAQWVTDVKACTAAPTPGRAPANVLKCLAKIRMPKACNCAKVALYCSITM